jgi:hypothetical protein
VHFNLGFALTDKGRTDEAIAEFREALRLKKDYPEAHMNLKDYPDGSANLDLTLSMQAGSYTPYA